MNSNKKRRPSPDTLGRARPSAATRRSARAASEASAALGPVIPAAEVHHDVTGRPVLGPDQVYVTRGGKRFHDAWCTTIAGVFDERPRAVIVTAVEDTGGRTRCANCDDPLTG